MISDGSARGVRRSLDWKGFLKWLVILLFSAGVVQFACLGIPYNPLTNTDWRFAYLMVDGEIRSGIRSTPRLEFGMPPEVEGSDGCNHFDGVYFATLWGCFSFRWRRKTLQLCELYLDTGETITVGDDIVMEILTSSRTYRIRDGHLWIYSGDRKRALVFRPD